MIAFRLVFMMKDFNGNSRTLIVSFVIAIMFLVPLRFVELGNQMSEVSQTQVLGASTTVSKKAVVLPNAAVNEKAVLEAPYDEIESGCRNREALVKKLSEGKLTQKEVDQTVAKIDYLDKNCK